MFRGTMNLNTFFATLEFVDNIARIAKNKTLLEIQSISFDELLTKTAKSYYESRKMMLEWDKEDE